MFRHTFATEPLKKMENIVTIARSMGPESLDTTRKYTKIVGRALVGGNEVRVRAASVIHIYILSYNRYNKLCRRKRAGET